MGCVAVDLARTGADPHLELQALLLGAGAVQGRHLAHVCGRVEHVQHQFHAARFDLGKIEHLVNDLHQLQHPAVHIAGVAALDLVERGGEHQFRHADDAVHRSADFVAHHGQETGLRFAGRIGHAHQGARLLGVLFAPLEQLAHHPERRRQRHQAAQRDPAQQAQVAPVAGQQQFLGDGGVDHEREVAHQPHRPHAVHGPPAGRFARAGAEQHVMLQAPGQYLAGGAGRDALAHHLLHLRPARQQRLVAPVQRDGRVFAQAHVAEEGAEEIARHPNQHHAGKAAMRVVEAPADVEGPFAVALVAHRLAEEGRAVGMGAVKDEVVAVGQIDGRGRIAAGEIEYRAVRVDHGGHVHLGQAADLVAHGLEQLLVADRGGQRRGAALLDRLHHLGQAVQHQVGRGHGLRHILGQHQ